MLPYRGGGQSGRGLSCVGLPLKECAPITLDAARSQDRQKVGLTHIGEFVYVRAQ
jgi:hypothetical protein